MTRAILLLMLLTPCLSAQEKEDAVRKDLKLMEGKWAMTALEVNGANVPPAKIEGTVLTIKDGVYTVAVKDRIVTRVKLVLDPGHDPKRLDMVFLDGDKKDESHKAIYRIDGDKMQIARGLNADQERPNQFATWPGTNYFVVTWTRQAK